MLRNDTFQTPQYSCQTSVHWSLGTHKGFSVEAVNLVLAGCPVDTRIHFNPNNRMGGRKLKSNFKSIKIEILPQYNNNIFTLGVLPKENSYPAVTIALWYVIFNRGVHLPSELAVFWAARNTKECRGSNTYKSHRQIGREDPPADCWQEASFHDLTGKELQIHQSKRYCSTIYLILAHEPRIAVKEHSPICWLTSPTFLDAWNKQSQFRH